MVCTTTLHDWELNQPTGDNELDELLSMARELTGSNYQIIQHDCWVKTGLVRWGWVKRFQLYVEVRGVFPWQVMACASDKPTITAYLYGVVNGVRKIKEGEQ